MGVNIDDTDLSWRGPGGMEGRVAKGSDGGGFGIQRRDGDWDCPSCGKMVFASKEECFSCGTPKPRGGGRDDYYGRGGGRSPPRRSPPRRGGGCYDDSPPRRGGGRYDDYSPPRRSSRYNDDRERPRRRYDYDDSP